MNDSDSHASGITALTLKWNISLERPAVEQRLASAAPAPAHDRAFVSMSSYRLSPYAEFVENRLFPQTIQYGIFHRLTGEVVVVSEPLRNRDHAAKRTVEIRYSLVDLSQTLFAAQQQALGNYLSQDKHFLQNATDLDLTGQRFDLIIANEVIADFPVASVARARRTNMEKCGRVTELSQSPAFHSLKKTRL